ncbi:Plasma membrane proteolipid 3 [Fulvia fulva]|uniref:Plasma membrane proteolipid 3 n=1 Tax=Passalora fulva TaxID=5499 RepID=A0A9Q8PE47_PASFU|nr:Plasma membrane proteolipid 3 [Fulvia fulva]KAK4618854.1 Plasma membrane proteolipid 3 [Fulvia fulva]UJO20790.1 Plasma membrane proteolipid 3 [Fulvia fulva]
MCGSDVFLGLIAILFPPLAVWVKRGVCSADSLINIALCCLGFLPGLLHAWYIIAVYPEPTYEEVAQQDAERGTVTYYYVQQGAPRYGPQGGQQGDYGTVNSTTNSQFPGQQAGFVQPQQPKTKKQATHPHANRPQAPEPQSLAGPSGEVPPSYAQAVAGDHKVQGP